MHVSNLSINGNNLTRGIPPSLSNISLLKIINLGYNKLLGSILP
jgi:hypothetical protein